MNTLVIKLSDKVSTATEPFNYIPIYLDTDKAIEAANTTGSEDLNFKSVLFITSPTYPIKIKLSNTDEIKFAALSLDCLTAELLDTKEISLDNPNSITVNGEKKYIAIQNVEGVKGIHNTKIYIPNTCICMGEDVHDWAPVFKNRMNIGAYLLASDINQSDISKLGYNIGIFFDEQVTKLKKQKCFYIYKVNDNVTRPYYTMTFKSNELSVIFEARDMNFSFSNPAGKIIYEENSKIQNINSIPEVLIHLNGKINILNGCSLNSSSYHFDSIDSVNYWVESFNDAYNNKITFISLSNTIITPKPTIDTSIIEAIYTNLNYTITFEDNK